MRKIWLLILLVLLKVDVASADTFQFHGPLTTGLENLSFTLDVKTARNFHVEVTQVVNGEMVVSYKRDYERSFAVTVLNLEVPLKVGLNSINFTDLTPTGTKLDPLMQPITRLGEALSIDERGTFESTFYTGIAIDTFAADEHRRYLNPDDDSSGLRERGVGGFDFAFRLFGGPAARHPVQLWVYGETIHGTRSTEVDCSAEGNQDKKICLSSSNAAQRTLYIMRNATSLEGFGGLRLEFLPLQRGETSSANLYLKLQGGFLSVAKGGGDVMDLHHFAVGAIATRGQLRNSYLEVGPGRSDVFQSKSKQRWKVDGYLEFPFKESFAFRPFVQLTIDADFGGGSDSVQSYAGINIDLEKFGALFK